MTETTGVRVTSETGGQKDAKVERYDLIDPDFLKELATQLGLGAEKYEEWNWSRGYPLSLSYAALMRHLQAWWSGERRDPEFGTDHMAAVAFHAMVLFVNGRALDAGVLPADMDSRRGDVPKLGVDG